MADDPEAESGAQAAVDEIRAKNDTDSDGRLEKEDASQPDQTDMDAKAKEFFDKMDKNHDGNVTKNELRQALLKNADMKAALKVKNLAEATKLIDGADEDADGSMDFEEFKKIWRALHEGAPQADAESHQIEMDEIDTMAKEIFDKIDKYRDGRVTKAELQGAMAMDPDIKNKLNLKSPRGASKLIDDADVDASGSMSFEEFKKVFRAMHEPQTTAAEDAAMGDTAASTSGTAPSPRAGDEILTAAETDLDASNEQQLRTLFERCDTNGDKSLNKRELIKICRTDKAVTEFFGLTTGIRFQNDGFEAFFKDIDDNSDSEISWEEFKAWYRQKLDSIKSQRLEGATPGVEANTLKKYIDGNAARIPLDLKHACINTALVFEGDGLETVIEDLEHSGVLKALAEILQDYMNSIDVKATSQPSAGRDSRISINKIDQLRLTNQQQAERLKELESQITHMNATLVKLNPFSTSVLPPYATSNVKLFDGISNQDAQQGPQLDKWGKIPLKQRLDARVKVGIEECKAACGLASRVHRTLHEMQRDLKNHNEYVNTIRANANAALEGPSTKPKGLAGLVLGS